MIRACLAVLMINATSFLAIAQNSIPLVGNKVPTLIDAQEYPARANALVQAIMDDAPITITATTQAWSGSGLRNGTFAGFIDHYSLNNQRNTYIYSEPYMSIPLHIASKNENAADISRLDKIYRTTVGVENRFANTDKMRSERSVRWARSPDFLGIIRQIGDERVDYILADKFMLDEVNKLLFDGNKAPLSIGKKPIYVVEVRLAIKADYPDAKQIVEKFNSTISDIQAEEIIANISDTALNAEDGDISMLDEALYVEIIRKW